MTPLPKFIPRGRLVELRERPDADRIAYTVPQNLFGDYGLRLYRSRAQLEAFCKAGSAHHALLKRVVHRTMLVNPNTEHTVA